MGTVYIYMHTKTATGDECGYKRARVGVCVCVHVFFVLIGPPKVWCSDRCKHRRENKNRFANQPVHGTSVGSGLNQLNTYRPTAGGNYTHTHTQTHLHIDTITHSTQTHLHTYTVFVYMYIRQ